ncbi:MAG: metal ABC transporter permease [Candidatus Kerfeldbacteria bacterium]|nr:metal ABC transporter permease [Candidatus Kerfeldbacteria bacterium]
MIDNLITMLSFPFIQRALLVGCIIAITSAFLGVFVTLRNMSFYTDAIAHSALAGIALGLLLHLPPLWATILFCILLGLITAYVKQRSQVSTDTVIGVLFAGGIALGIVLISQLEGYRADLFSLLFGDILAVSWNDIIISAGLSIIIVLFLLATGKRLVLSTFSSDFSYVRGVNAKAIDYAFFVITALTIAVGIQSIGIVLITGLLIIPAATSRNLARSFKQLAFIAALVSVIATLGGITLSYYFNLPSGPTIILVSVALFMLSLLHHR